ncbi:MAG: hypothetical protein BWY86_00413 [Candidatus Aminicenantes bacterium ADurb.Bin508]|nr:MAG: hypothetical protein BWY86_00413 [Candidatus Aminicenantes bacterium ADurb.Bin508]
MVAVGDVEEGDGGEERDDLLLNRLVLDDPKGVDNAVWGGEVVLGSLLALRYEDGIQVLPAAVGEEDRSGLGVEGDDVAGPVDLLVFPGELVLLDDVLLVIFHRGACDETCLDVVAHLLPVNVDVLLFVGNEDPFVYEAAEVFGRLGVDAVIVEVDTRVQVDLGLGDVKERDRVGFGHLPGLFGAENIVGRGREPNGDLLVGSESFEGFNESHCCLQL